MNTEKTLSPQESLALIANVVAQTKENYKQQSAFFLLWGGLVSAASFLHYILLTYSNFQPAYLPWLVLLPIGGAASIYLAKRKFTSNSSLTYYNHFLNTMWLTLYAAFAVAFVLCSKLSIQPACFMLLLAAIGTAISGFIMKNNAFVIGAICLAIGSVLCVFYTGKEQLLINGVAILLGYVLPNYFLTPKNESNV